MKRLVVPLILFASCFSTYANDDIQVVTEELRPLNYLENNQVKGSSTKIVRKVLKEANLTANIQVHPWARSYAMAQNKKNTLIYTINRTPDRESKFKWIGLLGAHNQGSYLFKLKSNDEIKAVTLEEAKQYSVGASLGDVNYEFLKSEGFKKIHGVPERNQSIKMLLRHRVDLIAGSYSILLEAFKALNEPIDKIEVLMPFKITRPYIAISNTSSDRLVNRIRAAYQRLVISGEIPDFEAQTARKAF